MNANLIVFEGIDGAGKATQVKLLEDRLRAEGKRVAVFASPRYDTPTGKIVKDALSGAYGDFVGLSPYLSALPYLLDFAASRDDIREALKEGIVICDRYISSTVAYHSAKLTGSLAEEFIGLVETIAYERLGMPLPDLHVYLEVPVETARRLMVSKKKDQHERDASYQARVATTYKSLAQRTNWTTIQCVHDGVMRSRDEIHAEIAALTL